MKLSLQLKLGQQLTMTPQLQQAIRLLQLSTLDLHQEIHQALESNPMLELIEGSDEEEAAHNSDFENNGADKNSESTPAQLQENASADSDPSDWRQQIPDELAVDSSWEDIYPTSYSSATSFDTDSMDFESHNTVVDTLQDHLLWQLNLTPMSDSDRSIALALIDAIDVNGMLTVDIESIHSGFYPDAEIELDEVLTVLHRIQQFDPVGVGYRDLAECLLIQLNQFEESQETTAVRNARLIVSEHIALLGNRDYAQLMRRTRLKEADLRKAIKIIESLDPHPGANISPPATSYIVPDVIVSKQADIGKWIIELNPDTTPKIRINDSYASLVKRADSSAENNYLKEPPGSPLVYKEFTESKRNLDESFDANCGTPERISGIWRGGNEASGAARHCRSGRHA